MHRPLTVRSSLFSLTVSIIHLSINVLKGITLASFSDYLGRMGTAFSFMKWQMSLVPGLGWVGSLNSAIPLSRSWDKDKVKIQKLCQKFKSDTDYKLVTPWYVLYRFYIFMYSRKRVCDHSDFNKKDVDVLSGGHPND